LIWWQEEQKTFATYPEEFSYEKWKTKTEGNCFTQDYLENGH